MDDGLVLQPGEGETIGIGASTVRLLAVGKDTGDVSSAEEIGVPPGFEGPPPHRHEVTAHAWYVAEGALVLTVGMTTAEVQEGGFVFVPRNSRHTFANPSHSWARMVQFSTPSGFETYLRELSASFPPGSEIERDRIVEIMARHDTYPVE